MRKEFIFILLLFFLFTSCFKQTVFVSDRHGLSYEIVNEQCKKNNCKTLILIDYHNDIKNDVKQITSSNWVGKLIIEKKVDKVYWISGGVLNIFNRNARMKWLGRNVANYTLEEQNLIYNTVELLDFEELKQMHFDKNVLITVDFDVFTKNPGPDAMDFNLQLCSWIQKQKCPLLTLSFSSPYYENPKEAFLWFNEFISAYEKDANWYLLSSDYSCMAEGNEELSAWEKWKKNPEIFNKYDSGFYKNGYFWLLLPANIQTTLLNKKILPYQNDSVTKEILNFWKNNEYITFKSQYTPEILSSYTQKIRNAYNEQKNINILDLQDTLSQKTNKEIAIRFINLEKNRDFVSPFFDIDDDLYINLSIFSKWEKLDNPYDFVPGIDSLIIENKNADNTNDFRILLQSAIAIEQNYSKKDFLECLCKKAKLPEDAYKNDEYTLYKSATLNYYEKF